MTEQRSDGIPTFHASTVADWHNWLAQHHQEEKAVWLIIYHKESPTPSITYPKAVDEALCWGWVDSKPNKRNDESFFQYFAARNPKSNWSKVNKEKIARLLAAGRMQPAGLAMVEGAKAAGTWDALNDVEAGVIPDDLLAAFAKFPGSEENFRAFPRSARRGILEWIFNAKRPATRTNRVEETAALAAENKRANQWPKS